MGLKLADEIKVALVTGACIIVMAILFKKVYHIQTDLLSTNGPTYVFIFYLISRGSKKRSNWDNPWIWMLAVIIVTVLTVVLTVR